MVSSLCVYICKMASFGRFQQVPPVVKNLIIINVLVFLLQNVLGDTVDTMFALHYWESPLFRWWQLFTHMFMHANLPHIFFNMFALWMFGSLVENMLGAQRFLMFYLICGLGAAFLHLSVLGFQFNGLHTAFMQFQEHPTVEAYAQFLRSRGLQDHGLIDAWRSVGNSSEYALAAVRSINNYYLSQINEATVGASGAVYGLLFAVGYLLPNLEFFLIFPPMPIKAKWMVAAYAAIELFSGIQNSAGDNVAHFAHLGGMLFAFILLKVWRTPRRMW